MRPIFFCIVLFILSSKALSGRAPTWDSCNCYWGTWSSWSDCSSKCGGGYRQRDRKVWHTDVPRCDGFEKCASNDMGSDMKACNNICYKNGKFVARSSIYGYCDCQKGTKGKCCEEIVTCGQPSSITHGSFSGSDYTYGHQITYTCDSDYNMTNKASAVQSCTEYGYWSHSSPSCVYAASCKSNPCQNQALCTNLLGDYRCACLSGWSGKNCDIDIQPPLFDHCPDDKEVFTASMTSKVNWSEPQFHDPLGKSVQVSKNYPESSFNFPWGHYSIQYSAVKPSNGLTNECVFNITVKPYPCKPLLAPIQGYVICNNWMTDYATICKVKCKKGYTFSPAFKEDDWYNCGASGIWLPYSAPSECFPSLQSNDEDANEEQVSDCFNKTEMTEVKDQYITALLESSFNSLCLDYRPLCDSNNVKITCGNQLI